MSDEISVILELTEREVLALRSLLLRGADWERSGKFGEVIAAIYGSLCDLVPSTPNYFPDNIPPFTYPVWRNPTSHE